MLDPCPLRERPRELATMVRLEHLDGERRDFFHTFEETQRCPHIRPLERPGVREASAHVEAGEYVHSRTVFSEKVNGVQLHQIARMLNVGTRRRHVPTPVPALLEEVVSV